MNKLKRLAVSIFGEDLWREGCEFTVALVWVHFHGDSEFTLIGLAVMIYGYGLFRRLRRFDDVTTRLASIEAKLNAR